MKPNITGERSHEASETPRTVRLQTEYPHSPERVWGALTDPNALALWLLPNSFSPQIGKRFAFVDRSKNGRRRKVHCQVVELDAPHRLAYTWQAEDENLPTLVAWTLEPIEAGTRVTLEHIGPAAPVAGEPNGLTVLANALSSDFSDRAALPASSLSPRRQRGRIAFNTNGGLQARGLNGLPASSGIVSKRLCGLSSPRPILHALNKEALSCIR